MSGKRGRPAASKVRQNIVEILYFSKKAYGYDIYRHYLEIFPKITLRLIYYHLKKGAALGVFEIESISKEEGDYSWGSSAEKIYYVLGPHAHPIIDDNVAKYFDALKKEE